jgi:hypothetical protein
MQGSLPFEIPGLETLHELEREIALPEAGGGLGRAFWSFDLGERVEYWDDSEGCFHQGVIQQQLDHGRYHILFNHGNLEHNVEEGRLRRQDGFQVRVTHPHRPYVEIHVVPDVDTISTVKHKANAAGREDALRVKFAGKIWPDNTLLRDVKVSGGIAIKPGETLHLIAQCRDTYHPEAPR